MRTIYQYRVNVGDNDHLTIYACDLRAVEEIVDARTGFSKDMINSVTRQMEVRE